jgi:hypothetical protein
MAQERTWFGLETRTAASPPEPSSTAVADQGRSAPDMSGLAPRALV